MITEQDAKLVIQWIERLKNLRLRMRELETVKFHAGEITVKGRTYSRTGYNEDRAFAISGGEAFAKIALGYVKAECQRNIDECVRSLNRLGAEVPK